MKIKEALEKLTAIEGGKELAATLTDAVAALEKEAVDAKGKLAEAAKEGEALKSRHGAILTALGLEDDDKAAEAAKALKETLAGFEKEGKKPDEVLKQMAALGKQVETVTKQLGDMTKTAEAEKAKRVAALKESGALSALTKGGAASPENIAKILLERIGVKDDDSLVYTDNGKELSVEDGAAAWLKANPWAVKTGGSPGGEGPAGGGGAGTDDPFLQGFGT
jgi:hypothetical protein